MWLGRHAYKRFALALADAHCIVMNGSIKVCCSKQVKDFTQGFHKTKKEDIE